MTLADNGIGMTFQEMKENLGSIAKSGTKAFVNKMNREGQDTSLIGQFGVGFYSSFLISNKVTVLSSSRGKNGMEYSMWSSNAKSSFTIEHLLPEEFAQRVSLVHDGFTADYFDFGKPQTYVLMNVKQDCLEYLHGDKIYSLIKRHSDFVAHPIYFMKNGAEKEKCNS